MLEYKKELKADLASRIPYGVMVQAKGWDKPIDIRELDLNRVFAKSTDLPKPYLRPLSSMNEEEKKEYGKICELDTEILANNPMNGEPFPALYNSQDWLDKNMFDYRGLIPLGLALEAPKDMYNF